MPKIYSDTAPATFFEFLSESLSSVFNKLLKNVLQDT